MRKIEDKVSVAKMLVYFEITKLVEWYMQVRQQLVAQFVVVNLTQQVPKKVRVTRDAIRMLLGLNRTRTLVKEELSDWILVYLVLKL